ncbi:MAG: sulfotransferase family protein [Steroidobacteraceae bacterium]|nr:sulfotransferase family protein [Steroidobacteraceae bacterium]
MTTLYAFVHIEKTAGRTVRAVLLRSFGAGHCEIRTPYAKREPEVDDRRVAVTSDDLRKVRRFYRRLRGIAGHNVKPYSDLQRAAPDLRYFTFLRDPVRRYLSHFKNRSRSYAREDFERWAAAGWTHDWQTRMIAGEASAQKAIDLIATRIGFVGFTETFDESLLMLGQWLGEPGFRPEYRPVNQLAGKQRTRDSAREQADLSYLETPEVRARLQEINALDQQVYDYALRECHVRQRAAYEGDLAADVANLRARNQTLAAWTEPLSSRLLRNWVYKSALVLRLA